MVDFKKPKLKFITVDHIFKIMFKTILLVKMYNLTMNNLRIKNTVMIPEQYKDKMKVNARTHTHIRTPPHTHTQTYIYICVCVLYIKDIVYIRTYLFQICSGLPPQITNRILSFLDVARQIQITLIYGKCVMMYHRYYMHSDVCRIFFLLNFVQLLHRKC